MAISMQWFTLLDGSIIRLEHVTFGQTHRVPGQYVVYTTDRPDALLFWAYRRRGNRKGGCFPPIDARVVDASGQSHRVIGRSCHTRAGFPSEDDYYQWELPQILPLGEPFSLQIALWQHLHYSDGPYVELSLPNTHDWLQRLKAAADAYHASPQRLHDDLVIAIYDDDLAHAGDLIRQGAVLDDIHPIGYNALHYVVSKGDRQLALWLIARGARINAGTATGHTPLMIAAESGNVELVRALLQQGAIVDARDQYGNTALRLASGANRKQVVKILSHAGGQM
jgi:hypothetical protein